MQEDRETAKDSKSAWLVLSLLNEYFPSQPVPTLSFSSFQRHGQYVWIRLHMCSFAMSDIFPHEWSWIYAVRLAQLKWGVVAYVIAAVELICLAVFSSTVFFCVCVWAALSLLSSASAMIADFTLELWHFLWNIRKIWDFSDIESYFSSLKDASKEKVISLATPSLFCVAL